MDSENVPCRGQHGERYRHGGLASIIQAQSVPVRIGYAR